MKAKLDRNLSLLFGGQFISRIGDRFYALALAFWVLRSTGSPERMGLVLFAASAPSILVGFMLGGVLDRWNRKTVLIAADLVRGAAVLGATALYFMGKLNLVAILATQVVLSLASAFFNPTLSALLPAIVEKDRLARANATSQMLGGAADILGPALGGLAVAWLGYPFAFLFDAASFLICAALNAGLRLPRSPEERILKAPLPALASTYRFLGENRRLMAILGVVALVHCFTGSISVITPVVASSLQGGGAQALGYLETSLGAGAVVCALLMRRAPLNGREQRFMFAGIGCLGAAMAAMGGLALTGVHALAPYLMLFPALSASVITIATCYTVIVQKAVTGGVAAGVFSVMGSVGNLSLPLSTLLFGFLLERAAWGGVALGCGAAVLTSLTLLPALYASAGRRAGRREAR
jgi:MFS family permease